jgi:hypothetical protein
MHDHARGGDDTLIGGASQINALYGDARIMDGDTSGGNDTLIAGVGLTIAGAPPVNALMGDAFEMHDNARGGNDTLIGADSGVNSLHGDARTMDGNSRGGNDTLIAGAAPVNNLYGDAFSMSGNARGGNDILISGPGTDHMWGDAAIINGVAASPTAPTGTVVTGADTFVFAPGSGNDDINDFRQSDHDKIDVSAYGFHNLADMTITADGGGNSKIAFDANDSVTLVGIADPHILHPSDFLLA